MLMVNMCGALKKITAIVTTSNINLIENIDKEYYSEANMFYYCKTKLVQRVKKQNQPIILLHSRSNMR